MFRRFGIARTVLAALILGCAFAVHAVAQDLGSAPPPISYLSMQRYLSDPVLLEQTRPSWATGSSRVTEPGTVTPATPSGGTWTAGTQPSAHPDLANPILMSDGTVIAQATNSANWYKLTPDKNGDYASGTWAKIANLPSGYTPRFFSSSVLPDGRVIIEGGEYNGGSTGVWTNLGAIYNPVANTWTSVAPPKGWTQIGDAQATLLANGTYYQADCCDGFGTGPFLSALLDEKTLTWTASGTGKFDLYDEEGWTLLPDDNVLTVDAYVGTGTCGQNSEIYDAATGAWSSAGNVGVQLADCANPGNKPSDELGPQVLRPDGSVVAFAGTTCNDVANASCKSGASGFIVTSHTAIFNSSNGSWSGGPNIPAVSGTSGCPTPCNYTLADAPAALEPNGTILFAASPNYQPFVTPTHFFELSPNNTITQVADPSASASADFNSFEYNFLVLPTGQIMAVQTDGPNVFYYNPVGSPKASWAPVITSVPTSLSPGASYTIAGTQLNGLSQGAYYGDDAQANTNYPLVRVTNTASGHVFYFKTTNSSTYSVAPNTSSTASFLVPALADIETGPSTLQVVTNGIASKAINVTISNTSPATLSVATVGNGTVTSSPPGIDCGVNATTCSATFAAGTVSLTQAPAWGWSFNNWGGACSGAGTCIVTLNTAQSVGATFSQGTPPSSPLVAAVLPESRSAMVGSSVTAFATMINSGNSTAPACAIAPIGNLPLGFTYQTTNPTTNALTGAANTPVNIGPGAPQTFVIALTPTAAFNPIQIPFSFACSNVVQAPIETGIDTLLLSASTTPVPDIVALVATASNDGILHIPGGFGASAFAVATVNLGAASSITASANTGATNLPLAISLCQTDPTSGQCLQAPSPTVTTTIAANATPTFAVFGQASGAIAFDPVNNRIFVQFAAPGGTVRGETSVAVETQ
jgi:hypothetical protein